MVTKRCSDILVEKENSDKAHNNVKKLEEMHFIMKKCITENLLNYS